MDKTKSRVNICEAIADLYKNHSVQATCNYHNGEMTYYMASFRSNKVKFIIECSIYDKNSTSTDRDVMFNRNKSAQIKLAICEEFHYQLFILPVNSKNTYTYSVPRNALTNTKYQIEVGKACDNPSIMNTDSTIQLPIPDEFNFRSKL
jgi:hypothetical protein